MAQDSSFMPQKKSLINDMRVSQGQDKNENVKLVEAAIAGFVFVVALGVIALYLKSKSESNNK
ncbi:MAG: hypothetical protein WBZ29_17585 [Methanocella sp.]